MATATVVSLNYVEPGVVSAKDDKVEEFLTPLTDVQQEQDSKPTLNVKVNTYYTDTISARPATVLLGTISDRSLRVRKAIPLDVSVEDGHVIVSWSDADEFAYGASTGDAIEELSKTVGELYFDLNDQTVPLGKDLARVRDVLNDHIEQVR